MMRTKEKLRRNIKCNIINHEVFVCIINAAMRMLLKVTYILCVAHMWYFDTLIQQICMRHQISRMAYDIKLFVLCSHF